MNPFVLTRHPEQSEGPHTRSWHVHSSFGAANRGREILRGPMAAQDGNVGKRDTEECIIFTFG
jgi:hypothetical protein